MDYLYAIDGGKINTATLPYPAISVASLVRYIVPDARIFEVNFASNGTWYAKYRINRCKHKIIGHMPA